MPDLKANLDRAFTKITSVRAICVVMLVATVCLLNLLVVFMPFFFTPRPTLNEYLDFLSKNPFFIYLASTCTLLVYAYVDRKDRQPPPKEGQTSSRKVTVEDADGSISSEKIETALSGPAAKTDVTPSTETKLEKKGP